MSAIMKKINFISNRKLLIFCLNEFIKSRETLTKKMVDLKTKKGKQNKTTTFEFYLNWQPAKIVDKNVRLYPFNIDSESSLDEQI